MSKLCPTKYLFITVQKRCLHLRRHKQNRTTIKSVISTNKIPATMPDKTAAFVSGEIGGT